MVAVAILVAVVLYIFHSQIVAAAVPLTAGLYALSRGLAKGCGTAFFPDSAWLRKNCPDRYVAPPSTGGARGSANPAVAK